MNTKRESMYLIQYEKVNYSANRKVVYGKNISVTVVTRAAT